MVLVMNVWMYMYESTKLTEPSLHTVDGHLDPLSSIESCVVIRILPLTGVQKSPAIAKNYSK